MCAPVPGAVGGVRAGALCCTCVPLPSAACAPAHTGCIIRVLGERKPGRHVSDDVALGLAITHPAIVHNSNHTALVL